ncbi:MAG: hypothetical protein CFH21_00941 [Alphaproteobacteria bacterium MarineAlpha5_Bin11]|nr:hypothetical protein [Pelagibacteraceae bacterium]PPR42995.1 MAG: hypothetical protein CFH21_00941 [Alphaproteobacteria bacterium MarineAlpha5_Bin11]|tara:strand:- start:32065 stop:32367 length:303 start_codon:yes stop_codon:yes gene_type:complete
MSKSDHDNSISDTLKVIKKAIEDDNEDMNIQDIHKEDVLILDKLIKEDGTIMTLNYDSTNNSDLINDQIDKKFKKIVDTKINKWIDKKMPEIIDKYLSKK